MFVSTQAKIAGKRRALAKPGNAEAKETPCGQTGKWTEGMVCSLCHELELPEVVGRRTTHVKPRVCMGRCKGAIHELQDVEFGL